jgi:hypothetical protein
LANHGAERYHGAKKQAGHGQGHQSGQAHTIVQEITSRGNPVGEERAQGN